MRFLINFFLILILVGCESIDLGYIDLIRENNQENIIEDLSPFYNTGYSFIRASKGRNQAVMVLSKFDDGVATWVGANNEIIITQNGIIIETQNLEYDLKIHQPLFSLSNLFKGNLSNYISLSNPDAKFIFATLDVISKTNKEFSFLCNKSILSLELNAKSIGYKNEINLCYNENNTVIRSTQRLNPFDNVIEIEFFYQ